MPNRIIKESLRTSRNVNALTDFEFRLWIYLITYVDDYGRGSADPELLKGLVFTRRKGITESQIEKGLSSLANTGMIHLYEVDGEPYFCFPNWGAHQRIQAQKAKFPPPPEQAESVFLQKPTVTHRDSPPEYEYESKKESESETESERGFTPAPAQDDKKHPHGELQNVFLTTQELLSLKDKHPSQYKDIIEDLSLYLSSTGRRYASHYATLLRWAKNGQPKAAQAARLSKPVSAQNYTQREYDESEYSKKVLFDLNHFGGDEE